VVTSFHSSSSKLAGGWPGAGRLYLRLSALKQVEMVFGMLLLLDNNQVKEF